MSTLNKEWLLTTIAELEEERDAFPGVVNVDAAMALAAMKLALASLESEPVCVIDQSSLDYLKSGSDADVWPASRKEMGDVLLYRAAPPAPVVPAELHPDTQKLVTDFCTALAEKLYKAQLKYGYDADWKQDGWPTQCQAHFHQHIAKGDPRDVAAYCAFMWYHGWKTEPVPVSVPDLKPVGFLFVSNDGAVAYSPADWPMKGFNLIGPIYGDVNACRTAMLQGAEPVTTAYKLPEGWVACSERLPPEGYEPDGGAVCYLVWHKNEVDCGPQYSISNVFFLRKHWEKNFTHWMSLPAAPKQEADNG